MYPREYSYKDLVINYLILSICNIRDLYLVIRVFVQFTEIVRTKLKVKYKTMKRRGSKREDMSVTHELKSNNTAKSCINHSQ